MKNHKILVIDDDKDLAKVYRHIVNQIFEIDFEYSLESGLAKIKDNQYALILLDLCFEDQKSLDWLEYDYFDDRILLNKIILCTAQGSLDDKIKTHKLGVRDYIQKPFNLTLASTIIDKHLYQLINSKKNIIQVGPFRMDLLKQEFFIDKGDNVIQLKLTSKEYKIVQLLLSNEGRIVSRDTIISKVYHEEKDLKTRVIDMHVSSLRKKTKELSDCILTKRSVGYLFDSTKLKSAA